MIRSTNTGAHNAFSLRPPLKTRDRKSTLSCLFPTANFHFLSKRYRLCTPLIPLFLLSYNICNSSPTIRTSSSAENRCAVNTVRCNPYQTLLNPTVASNRYSDFCVWSWWHPSSCNPSSLNDILPVSPSLLSSESHLYAEYTPQS